MIVLSEFTLTNGSILNTVISHSLFTSNLARYKGGGVYLSSDNVIIDSNASIIVNVHDNDFVDNACSHAIDDESKYQGGGLYFRIKSISLTRQSSFRCEIDGCLFKSNTAVRGGGIIVAMKSISAESTGSLYVEVQHSIFTSNKAVSGAGIAVEVISCSLNSNSFLMLLTSDSTFTSNMAEWTGAGFYATLESNSLQLNSSLTQYIYGSNFSSNTAEKGAGICTEVYVCSLNSNSSVLLQTTDSSITSNKAKSAGGVDMTVFQCSLNYNSTFMIQTTESSFTSNIAERRAGIFLYIQWCTLHSSSVFELQTNDCSFISNRATDRGAEMEVSQTGMDIPGDTYLIQLISNCTFLGNVAGKGGLLLSLNSGPTMQGLHHIRIVACSFINNTSLRGEGAGLSMTDTDQSVSGQVFIDVTECLFLNNSAKKEGGALYFKVLSCTQVSVTFSHFEANMAVAGSGLYRENVNENPSNTDGSVLVERCSFIGNIDTALIVNDHTRKGKFQIIKSIFENNWCDRSLFAEDIFTDMTLILEDIKIWKQRKLLNVVSINSLAHSMVNGVTMTITGQAMHRQIRVASFFHYLTSDIDHQFQFHCPEFFRPNLAIAGMTDQGALMISCTCKSCIEGYYKGESQLTIQASTQQHQHCYSKELRSIYGELTGRFSTFCHSAINGECIECPHGANCSVGVVSLPNYWGHFTNENQLQFHRCPVGYCCNQDPCQFIAQCAAHREGTLCSRCMKGFSESLLTPDCIPEKFCNDWWIFPLYCCWTLAVTLCILFSQDILGVKEKIRTHLKKRKSRKKNMGRNPNNSDGDMELGIIDSREIATPKYSAPRRNSDGIDFEGISSSKLRSINIQTIEIKSSECPEKVPILCGLLTMQRGEITEASGSHKYLQIMLYYLQDASLMQIDLALASTVVTPIQKVRQLLLNFSQLAVDMIDLGLNLCPFSDWTPASKLLHKNLTGPFVFFYLVVIYGIVRVACLCFPCSRKSIESKWYPRLTTATIFSILLFYQQMANVTFSMLYCIKSGDEAILFIDGTVICYQSWQILVFIFAFNWVVGIIPVLMFLPGLLELRLITISHFFLACLMPGPMLLYWLVRFYKSKLVVLTSEDNVTLWHEEALKILQKTFAKTTDRRGLPFCWIGFVKVRRLTLVIIFTFVSNLVARVSLMCLVIQVFLMFHLEAKPYRDDLANRVYSASLFSTLAIGLLNIMKASCVEFYLDLDKVAHFLTILDLITDCILVYCPLGFIGLTITAIITGKLRTVIQKKRAKQN